MTLRWMRMGFFSFFLLSAAFAANLLMLQPLDGRKPLARALTARPVAARTEKPSEIATGSLTILNAASSGTATAVKSGKAEAAGPPGTGGDSAEVVRAVQRELQARGYETGAADGMPGLVTRAAIMAFEADHAMALTGVASEPLLQTILLGAPAGQRNAKAPPPGPEAEQVIRTVQQSLTSLGYQPGAVDGRLGAATLQTIREFEKDQDMPETGRISGHLVARLARLAGQGRLADGR